MRCKMNTHLRHCKGHRQLLLKITFALLVVLIMLRLFSAWVSSRGTYRTSRLFQESDKTDHLDSMTPNDSSPKYTESTENTGNTQKTPPPKRILFWTTFWGSHDSWRSVFVDMLRGRCPASDCILFYNREELSRADAVVFHLNSRDLNTSQLPARHRPAGQIWVLFSLESPAHQRIQDINLKALNGLFNWTMTYRWDSDLPMPYGLVLPRVAMSDTVSLTSLPETVRQALPKRHAFERSRRPALKKRLVSWMVSKCDTPSSRGDYVRQLEQHVQVDVFGKCGKQKCGHRDTLGYQDAKASNDECEEVIATSKFYLAFENSICPQYTTEKFFRTMKLGTVPVVLGAANYSQLAPEGSYIDALRYQPAELGRLLRYLDRNDTAYSEFFRWQDHFSVLNSFPLRPLTCSLCQRLHQLPPGALVGSHAALERWYGADQCSSWTTKPV